MNQTEKYLKYTGLIKGEYVIPKIQKMLTLLMIIMNLIQVYKAINGLDG